MTTALLEDRFALVFNKDSYRREIGGTNVIIHCHHYNARLQAVIEGAASIDGKEIIRSSAEAVFRNQFRRLLRKEDGEESARRLWESLYAHLGFGRLDASRLDEGVVTASHSHYVEGWRAGLGARKEPLCTMTEGYLQGVLSELCGQRVAVREEQCLVEGHDRCVFRVSEHEEADSPEYPTRSVPALSGETRAPLRSETVDEETIIEALVAMPIHGNEEGLIPGFNVYLANTPADFYNLICIRFVEEMSAAGLQRAACSELKNAGETCGLNTFRGIMSSPEWDGLIAPMVKEPADNLFGLVAVSNALGWGNWRIVEHVPEENLCLETRNGYEAEGYLELRGRSQEATCYMMAGVSAGMMELVYGAGSVEERFGQCSSSEERCLCAGDDRCSFHVEFLM